MLRSQGFCYPYGAVDQRGRDAVTGRRVRVRLRHRPRTLNGPHALPRIHIGENDTAPPACQVRLHRLRRRPVEGV